MTRASHLFVFALATTLIAVTTARADVINWDYSWSMSPVGDAVYADAPGQGKIVFDVEQPGSGINSSDIGATNLRTVSNALDAFPDLFRTGGLYTLTLTLTDEQSALTGSVTFSGKFTGTFSAGTANVGNDFIGDTTKTLYLGNYVYAISVGGYVPPGPPGSTNTGSIGAHVDVSGGVGIEEAPEPSALVLSCLGAVGLLGVTGRRLRRRLTAA
jgi:hypothetical protein